MPCRELKRKVIPTFPVIALTFKCVFENPGLSCEGCKKRGSVCSAKMRPYEWREFQDEHTYKKPEEALHYKESFQPDVSNISAWEPPTLSPPSNFSFTEPLPRPASGQFRASNELIFSLAAWL
jgi:hypothetical protein